MNKSKKNYNSLMERLLYNDLPKLMENIKYWFLRKSDAIKHSNVFVLAMILLLISFGCFATTYFQNYFTVPLGGDYILQEMPFIYNGYDDWMHYFHTGEFPLWDTSGFLGVNNIGANNFYYLTSPWFMIYLLFPRSFLPQVQGILQMVKLMTAGLLFYAYLGSFKLEEKTKKMGAIAFAFCGWMFYNLWFHFIDAATFLPLLLLGIERVFKKKGPIVLILSITLLGLTNYFFLAVFLISSMFYVFFRFFQTIKDRDLKTTGKIFADGVIGYALGLALVAIVVLPSIITVLDMPRISGGSNFLTLLKNAAGITAKLRLLFYFEKPYEAVYPLTSFFFMNITCFSTNLFRNSYYNNTMSSIFVFTPLILMLVPSILNSIRTRKWSHLIGCFVTMMMLFTPFAYYLFSAFTLGYGRWQLMAVAWMIPFFLIHYDQRKKMPTWYLDISVIFTLLMMVVGYVLADRIQKENSYFFQPHDGRNIIVPLQMAYAVVVYIVLRTMLKKRQLSSTLIFLMGFEAVVMGNVTIVVHGIQEYKYLAGGLTVVKEQTKIASRLENYDDDFYRVFNVAADRGANNQAMKLGYNGVGTFHSVYPFQSKDLIEWSAINYNDSWSMGAHEKRYILDTMLGVKYYMVYKDSYNSYNSARNIPYGYTHIEKLDSSEDAKLASLQESVKSSFTTDLYQNQNFIDTFFVYDKVISSSAQKRASVYSPVENSNESKYLKYAIIDKKVLADIKKDEEASGVEDGLYSRLAPTTDITSKLALEAEKTLIRPTTRSDIYYANYDEKTGQLITGTPEEGVDYLYYINPADTKYDYHSYVNNPSIDKGLTPLSKIVFTPNTPICPNADPSIPESGCYVSVNARFGYNFRWHLYGPEYVGQDGKTTADLVTYDNHYYNGYDKSYDWKYARGFYVNQPIHKISGLFFDSVTNLRDALKAAPNVEYSLNSVYQSDIDRLKKEREFIDITKRGANFINFDTTFTEDKMHFTVINHPLDEGWTLRRNYKSSSGKLLEEEVPIYKTQGGLMGFEAINSPLADDGTPTLIHYELNYFPKGLDTGRIITFLGIMATTLLGGIFIFLTADPNHYKSSLSSLKSDYYDKVYWEKKKKIHRRYSK